MDQKKGRVCYSDLGNKITIEVLDAKKPKTIHLDMENKFILSGQKIEISKKKKIDLMLEFESAQEAKLWCDINRRIATVNAARISVREAFWFDQKELIPLYEQVQIVWERLMSQTISMYQSVMPMNCDSENFDADQYRKQSTPQIML
jgi:hypothetical protein